MPRPTEVSQADLARWERRFDAVRPSLPAPLLRLPQFREQFFAGEWLGEQLLARGLTADQASDVCFAHGQKCAHGGDPWALAQEVLLDVEQGRPPVPGRSLADELIQQAGLADNVDGMLEFLLAKGITPEEMDRMVDTFRQSPRFPAAQYSGREAVLFKVLASHKLPNLSVDCMVMTYRRRWHERRGR